MAGDEIILLGRYHWLHSKVEPGIHQRVLHVWYDRTNEVLSEIFAFKFWDSFDRNTSVMSQCARCSFFFRAHITTAMHPTEIGLCYFEAMGMCTQDFSQKRLQKWEINQQPLED